MSIKKFLVFLIIGVMAVSFVIPAYASEICGTALNSDIITYINNYAIETYIVDGTSVVVAEDLRMYGFDVAWDAEARTLSVSRNSATEVTPNLFFKHREPTGSKYCDLYTTDIKTYAAGTEVTAYNMNGFTMIPVEELTMLGEVQWFETERILKMTVEGLAVSESLTGAYYRMYSVDGRHMDVVVPEAEAYKAVGWYLPEDIVNERAKALLNENGYATTVSTLEAELPDITDVFMKKAYEKQIAELYNSWYSVTGIPVAIISYSVDFTENGYPRASITFRNISTATITSFDVGFECYDANVETIPDSLILASANKTLAPRETTTSRWTLKKFPSAIGIAAPEIILVKFADGSSVRYK